MICDEEWHVESAITSVESGTGDRTEQVVLLSSCETDTLLVRVMRTPQSIMSAA